MSAYYGQSTNPMAILQSRGLGFAQGESGGGDDLYGDYDYQFDYGGNYGGGDWGGWFEDPFGNYFEYDWFNLPVDENLTADTFRIDTFAPSNLPGYRDITGNLDYRDSSWDWFLNLGPGPAPLDPQFGSNVPHLPPACYGETYHPYPIGHPQQDICVSSSPNDPNAKKRADAQKKAQQQAAQAARKVQQQQNKTCPKDPQGRQVWKNPQTGKCELVPPCPQGQKFDSTTRRCLTANELKQVYGDTNWLLWLLIGGGALLLLSKRDSGGRRR